MVDKRVKFLLNGEIEFNGIVYPWKTAIGNKSFDNEFDKNKWFEHWEKIIQEVKCLRLEYYQIKDIHDSFKEDIMTYGLLPQMIKEHQKINELGAKLKLSFHQAYSNYRDSRRGFWGFVSGLFASKALDKLEIESLLNFKK